jgi:hypothetical protein
MAVIVWQLDLQLHVKSVHITTEGVSSNPTIGEVYSIQHYVIPCVSDMRHFGGFLRVPRFPHPIKLTSTIY